MESLPQEYHRGVSGTTLYNHGQHMFVVWAWYGEKDVYNTMDIIVQLVV